MSVLTGSSIVVASRDQVAHVLGEQVVLLNFNSGIYFSMEAVAARAWQLLQEPRSVHELVATLLEEYDVDALRCKQDLIAWLGKLQEAELIEVRAS